jgi:hypothetical protein
LAFADRLNSASFFVLNGFVFGIFAHRPNAGARTSPRDRLRARGGGPHGLRNETTREIRCTREQERERSDGSGYTASTTALRAPPKQLNHR